MNNIVYSVNSRPPFGKIILSAFQQLLAILAATIAVPAIIGNGMSQSAALFGAGVGTLIYLLFTRMKSPVFLGSSFAFLGSMAAAFSGATTVAMGYSGLIMGACLAGIVYCIFSLLVKLFGTGWINRLMPPIVIGPTVAIIGLSLAPNAISDLRLGNVIEEGVVLANPNVCVLIGVLTLIAIVVFSVFAKTSVRMFPFIVGIVVGYAIAAILTLIGNLNDFDQIKIIDFSVFKNFQWVPDFTFLQAFKGFKDFSSAGEFFKYFGAIAVSYIPVSFVVFAEHIADHKNLSSIIGEDLLTKPGLHRTLLGDGLGSFVGSVFGGCPNTTYGESIACVAISGNASSIVTLATALLAIGVSFFGPFVTFLASIPKCVMGGVCIALYGFIAVSGLKMLREVDLNENKNIFVISTILITGVGGLVLQFNHIEIRTVACALVLGIIMNLLVNYKKKEKPNEEEENNGV